MGLAPFVSPQRPRDAARWWCATGVREGDTLRVGTLEESATHRDPGGARCGLAAPCSLPEPFLAFLGVRTSAEVALSAAQLRARARAYAAAAPRGKRHPRRDENESISAMDPRRLPLFHAALPLLRTEATLVEVDPVRVLSELDVECDGLGGAGRSAIDRRVRILQALHESVLGFSVDVRARDYAVASPHALFAVLAAAVAART